MDNSQNVQQETESTVIEPKITGKENTPKPENSLVIFYWILLFFVGLTICLGVAISGYNDLSSVENSLQDESNIALQEDQDTNTNAETPEPIVKSSNNDNPLNLLMGIAIAGCCTTSLVIIFHWRKR